MCRSSAETGGPRRCSGDTRSTYQRSAAAVDQLERDESRLQGAVGSEPAAGDAGAQESVWLVGTPRHRWTLLGEGQYGQVLMSPDGTRAVKEVLDGRQFGRYEVELACKMGELGHSPRVFSAAETFIEMEVAPGKPLWSQYKRGEEEPVMTTAQAAKVAAALHDLHRLGFAHGDLHPLQLICDGDDVKMVDFGLSVRHEDSSVKAMQDLNKIGALVRWDNEELQSIPYVRLVMKYLPQYRAVAGRSQAAIAQREEIAKLYLKELEEL